VVRLVSERRLTRADANLSSPSGRRHQDECQFLAVILIDAFPIIFGPGFHDLDIRSALGSGGGIASGCRPAGGQDQGFEHAAGVPGDSLAVGMGVAREGNPRADSGQLRAVAVAGKDAVARAHFREGGARRLQRREGLFSDVSRLLSGGEFVPAAGQGERAVPGDLESARALGERAHGRHG